MGVNNPQYIFQQKVNDLFHGLRFVRAYIYEILILTKGDWTYHVQNLKLTSNKPKEKDLNIIY